MSLLLHEVMTRYRSFAPHNVMLLFMTALRSRCGRYIWLTASDHYFRSVCWFVCLFVCAEFFSAVFDPISIKLGHVLYVWV